MSRIITTTIEDAFAVANNLPTERLLDILSTTTSLIQKRIIEDILHARDLDFVNSLSN